LKARTGIRIEQFQQIALVLFGAGLYHLAIFKLEFNAFDGAPLGSGVEAVSAQASVAAKRTPQSTHPDAVRAALEELKHWLEGGRQ